MKAVKPHVQDNNESTLPGNLSTFVFLLTSQCVTTAQLNQFFFTQRIKSRKTKRLATRLWNGESPKDPFFNASPISRGARFEGHPVRIPIWMET